MVIAVDFDGTVVEHEYPKIGAERPFATDTLRMLMQDGHQLVLWTVREGQLLQDAIDWCKERGVEFWAINRGYPEEEGTHTNFSRKPKVDLWIDDRNIGGIPDWGEIYQMIKSGNPFSRYTGFNNQYEGPGAVQQPKKKWWQRL